MKIFQDLSIKMLILEVTYNLDCMMNLLPVWHCLVTSPDFFLLHRKLHG